MCLVPRGAKPTLAGNIRRPLRRQMLRWLGKRVGSVVVYAVVEVLDAHSVAEIVQKDEVPCQPTVHIVKELEVDESPVLDEIASVPCPGM